MKKNTTYIAGKVSGQPYIDAYLKFLSAEKKLKSYTKVVNPMRLCCTSWSWTRCMFVCLYHLIFKCDKICLLYDWNQSRGARIERRVAQIFRKKQVSIYNTDEKEKYLRSWSSAGEQLQSVMTHRSIMF